MIREGKETILEIVREIPGTNQAAILREFIKRSGRKVSQGFIYHKCQELLREGVIRLERRGMSNAYYLQSSATGAATRASEMWYKIQESVDGQLVVVSYTVGDSTVQLRKGLPLDLLPEFHASQLKYRDYLTG
jgi:hypothetical protein